MTNRQSPPIWTPALIGLASLLISCSPPAAQAPVQTTQIVGGKVNRGVVVVARSVKLASDPSPSMAGVNGVLAALHQPLTPSASISATEYVIQRSDDTTVSVVIGASDAASAGSFSVGDHVEIVDGTRAELIHDN